MSNLLSLIADVYAADTVDCDGMLTAAADELRRLATLAPIAEAPLRLPVCRWLPAMFEGAQGGPLAIVAEAFAAIEPQCRWRQNPNYTHKTIGPAFIENYGYVELVGRDRPWPSDRLAVGFLALGPGAHYPAHHHPAAEVYHVVSGVADWRRGDAPFSPRPLGTAIYHAPNVIHATHVLAEPLLALYCWSGDIMVAARLS